ncbi:MAG: metallophosphoesterase [Bacteroidota bacterium]
MKIIQITDLHIGRRGEETHQVDVRSNFLNILAEVKFANADHLVVSGDLCYMDGTKSTYNWIKARLARLRIPYEVISGNHDSTPLMKEVFELDHLGKGDELYYARKIGKWTCLFLDSSRGHHSKNQLKWLKRQLHNANHDLIIFMHHPPAKAGVPFMDNKHALQDIEAVQEILFDCPHNITIFCGHYHVEKTVRIKNLLIQITPSTYFQIDQTSPEFKIDHHRIALREIHLNGKSVETTVRYFDGNKM